MKIQKTIHEEATEAHPITNPIEKKGWFVNRECTVKLDTRILYRLSNRTCTECPHMANSIIIMTA